MVVVGVECRRGNGVQMLQMRPWGLMATINT